MHIIIIACMRVKLAGEGGGEGGGLIGHLALPFCEEWLDEDFGRERSTDGVARHTNDG